MKGVKCKSEGCNVVTSHKSGYCPVCREMRPVLRKRLLKGGGR